LIIKLLLLLNYYIIFKFLSVDLKKITLPICTWVFYYDLTCQAKVRLVVKSRKKEEVVRGQIILGIFGL
jgi:hypothetical protein